MELNIKQEPEDEVILNCFSCQKEQSIYVHSAQNVHPHYCESCEAKEYMQQDHIVVQNCFSCQKEDSINGHIQQNGQPYYCESCEAKEYMQEEPIVVQNCFSFRKEESMDVQTGRESCESKDKEYELQSVWTYSEATTSCIQYVNQEMIVVFESQSLYTLESTVK